MYNISGKEPQNPSIQVFAPTLTPCCPVSHSRDQRGFYLKQYCLKKPALVRRFPYFHRRITIQSNLQITHVRC